MTQTRLKPLTGVRVLDFTVTPPGGARYLLRRRARAPSEIATFASTGAI